MTCICHTAGYCPYLKTQVSIEQHAQCQSDPAWQEKELNVRGIRYRVPTGGMKTADAGCIPCQSAAPPKRKPVSTLPPIDVSAIGPVVSNRAGRAATSLRDQFAGQRCFLLGGGPSLKGVDLAALQRPGITIAAMNNVATMIRPNIWFCVDQPRNFHETIWRDPGVMKFTFDKHLPTCSVDAWNGREFVHSGLRAKDCPNVWGFAHRHGWDANAFLTDHVPTWGVNSAEEDPDKQSRHQTVMLPALWLLYWLGFRVVYLLGCDFTIPADWKYAFDERMAPGNDTLFPWLNRRLTEVNPHFREMGFTVLNCTEGSQLTAFERLPLSAAIEATLEGWPEEIVTKGHYRG
jgi:hypothetical protein